MTIANAFNDARSPIVGSTRKTGPSSAPAAAARPDPIANVAVWIARMLTPISAAVSLSWKVARIARPSFVRLIRT